MVDEKENKFDLIPELVEKDYVGKMANVFSENFLGLNSDQLKIMYSIILAAQSDNYFSNLPNEKPYDYFAVNKDDLFDALNISPEEDSDIYDKVFRQIKRLGVASQVDRVLDKTNDIRIAQQFFTGEVVSVNSYYAIYINPKYKDEFIALCKTTKNYSSIPQKDIKLLKSQKAINLYEFLRTKEGLNKYKMADVEDGYNVIVSTYELMCAFAKDGNIYKKTSGVYNYAMIEEYIIEPAIAEIEDVIKNSSDESRGGVIFLPFEDGKKYKKIKEGRDVLGYQFNVIMKKMKLKKPAKLSQDKLLEELKINKLQDKVSSVNEIKNNDEEGDDIQW